MTRKEGRNAPGPNRVWHTTDYTPVTDATLRHNELFEGTEKLKFPNACSKLRTQCIDFDMTDYVIHWTKAASSPILLATGLADNGWKIRETGFTSLEVKNEIFFHRAVANHNQLTHPPQVDAAKVRSNAIIKPAHGKEIGIVIKLSTLVEIFRTKYSSPQLEFPLCPMARTSRTTTRD